jgi:hypothetical protein
MAPISMGALFSPLDVACLLLDAEEGSRAGGAFFPRFPGGAAAEMLTSTNNESDQCRNNIAANNIQQKSYLNGQNRVSLSRRGWAYLCVERRVGDQLGGGSRVCKIFIPPSPKGRHGTQWGVSVDRKTRLQNHLAEGR